jgi:hypothetical protein
MAKNLLKYKKSHINLELVHSIMLDGFNKYVVKTADLTYHVNKHTDPEAFSVIEDWIKGHELKPRPRPTPRDVQEHKPKPDDKPIPPDPNDELYIERLLNEAGRTLGEKGLKP